MTNSALVSGGNVRAISRRAPRVSGQFVFGLVFAVAGVATMLVAFFLPMVFPHWVSAADSPHVFFMGIMVAALGWVSCVVKHY